MGSECAEESTNVTFNSELKGFLLSGLQVSRGQNVGHLSMYQRQIKQEENMIQVRFRGKKFRGI